MGGVGVVVYTTVEHGGGVLANSGADHSLTTGVVLDEVGHIVNNTSNSNEAAAVLGLLNIVVPLQHRELVEGSTPVKISTLAVELLL